MIDGNHQPSTKSGRLSSDCPCSLVRPHPCVGCVRVGGRVSRSDGAGPACERGARSTFRSLPLRANGLHPAAHFSLWHDRGRPDGRGQPSPGGGRRRSSQSQPAAFISGPRTQAMDLNLKRGFLHGFKKKEGATRFPASSLVARRRRVFPPPPRGCEELPRGPSPSVTTSQVGLLPLKFLIWNVPSCMLGRSGCRRVPNHHSAALCCALFVTTCDFVFELFKKGHSQSQSEGVKC